MKIKWGVIGGGGIADRRTMPGMLLAGNAELAGIMEVNGDLAGKLGEKYGVKAYDSIESLFAGCECDAVYIASPVVYHKEQILAAADAGKHILVEKPVALTAGEAQEAADYCEKKGVLLAAGFMMRFAAYHQQMKKWVAEGKLGKVVNASGQFTCWYPEIKGAWRQKKSLSGGGALMDMGVHVIDLLQYVTGSRIRRVGAFCDTKTFSYEVDDSASLLVQFESGANGCIHANFNIPDEAAKWRVEFYGTKGRIIGDETIGQAEAGEVDALFTGGGAGYDAAQNKKTARQAEAEVELGNMYTKEIESFGESLLKGLPLECPAADAVFVQRVAEAAYLSAETGKFISLL
jgi:predicted dehydrogenase